MRRYRGVLLDVDGTLVASNDAHAHAWEDAFSEYGLVIPYLRIRKRIGMGGDQLVEELAGFPRGSQPNRELGELRGKMFASRWRATVTPLVDSRTLVLQLAAAEYLVAIASSAKADELQPLLAIAHVDDLCDVRTTADDVDNAKPSPDVIEVASDRLGLEPSQVVLIGDTPYDVAAARRAGVDIIGVTTGGFSVDELAGAIAVYDGPAGLLAAWATSPLG